MLKQNKFTVLCEKSKMVSSASTKMKNITVFPTQYRFPIKLIYCSAFGSTSRSCCLSKSIAIILC